MLTFVFWRWGVGGGSDRGGVWVDGVGGGSIGVVTKHTNNTEKKHPKALS